MVAETQIEPRHPIRVVVRRTGLKPELIRAWERRHGAIEPQRTEGRHRLYSDEDIERLILLRDATAAGHSIGRIAQLDLPALSRLTVAEELAASLATEGEDSDQPFGEQPRLDACLPLIRRLDMHELGAELERTLVDLGPIRTLGEVVVPLVNRVGDLWHRGELRTMHEHLATTTIRAFIERLMRRHQPNGPAPGLVSTTPAGQRHEVGALLVAATAALSGWRVTWLGADLPAEEIAAAVHTTESTALALSITHPVDDPDLGPELLQLLRHLGSDIPILVGGPAASAYSRFLEQIHAVQVEQIDHLSTVLEELRNGLRPKGTRRQASLRPSGQVLQPGSRRGVEVSQRARRRYRLSQPFLAADGRLRLHDLSEIRVLAQHLGEVGSGEVGRVEPRAGLLFALGLTQEAAHRLLDSYRSTQDPQVLDRALSWLHNSFGAPSVERCLEGFRNLFLGPTSRDNGAEPHDAESALERLLLLWLANRNPAFTPVRDLFDDRELEDLTGYGRMMASLETFFRRQPPCGTNGENLFDLLRQPAREAPGSAQRQLELVRTIEQQVVEFHADQLLLAQDVLREEEKPVWDGPPGSSEAPAEPRILGETKASWVRDREEPAWMLEAVLVVKNVWVWLDQLSQRLGREIRRLDDIPQEALETIVGRGVNTLWLLGLWERSPASQTIKRRDGNSEALASAYALSEYRIADELGGEAAFDTLCQRADAASLRLAGDFVPNHMGLDSPWVLEHPERFISLPASPFPGYTFTGGDLSPDPRVSLHLEDHYLDHSDAAVVFRRVDRETGEERFLYHGNDGTGLPWNDTAQLDYSQKAVRELMLGILVEIAQRFPVVRIDAAMTLVKEHIQRLWFPRPGQGGAIPSRAERGLSQEEFDALVPEEFWREAVERVEEKAPGTLLLAEGFWLLEEYFVRNLGIHRVYNSAFMHLLRAEENGKFRRLLASSLETDPALLTRFVNFLTTPDEDPAAQQLGKGDKYFALATLLATLPGLPLFGHGQFDGLAEKYGMEYRRAYYSESPDRAVVERHAREIFPLLRARSRFAHPEDFRLWEVRGLDGESLDDVIAVSNGRGTERTLVVVHNCHRTVRAVLRSSVPYRQDGVLRTDHLTDALALTADAFHLAREPRHGREYLFSGRTVHEDGLELTLGPYEALVLTDFHALHDTADGRLERRCRELHGRGEHGLAEQLGYRMPEIFGAMEVERKT